MLTDKYNRFHNYLRVSLTDACNLRCFYCMPEEDYAFTPHNKLMQADEVEGIVKVFVQHGVNKIRFTGGEPLVRKDAADIIRRVSQMPAKFTLTTNGIRINNFIDVLEKHHLKSINISLDTLDEQKFSLLTKRDYFKRVYNNIQLLLKRDFYVKINMVVVASINVNEILDFVEWTKDVPVHVRFIEFMPFSGNKWESKKVFTWQDILAKVKEKYTINPIPREKHETVKKYSIKNHKGTFAVISTMSAPFCSDCNRIRLTADGKLKNCLFSSSETDLLTPYRNGEDIVKIIQKNILSKAEKLGGQFTNDIDKVDTSQMTNRSMITIGG